MGKLILEKLEKEFENVTAVRNLSLTVEDGQFLTVVGPSGCGKTTLLRMVAGFSEPTRGRIELDGDVLFDGKTMPHAMPPEDRDIGMVFQTYAVWPHMNVFNNVAYPLKIRKESRAKIREDVTEILKLVHLDGYEKRMAFEMSGGQQQRVALARALVMRPRLLLLDEPFSNLDAVLREEMGREVKEIHKKLGITVINVTHDQSEAMALSDRVAVMRGGELVQEGTPQAVYRTPVNTFAAGFIGKANILKAVKEKGAPPAADGSMRVRLMDGTSLRVPYVGSDAEQGWVVFRAHQILYDPAGDLPLCVTSCQFQGDSYQYLLTTNTDETVRMRTPASLRFETGDVVPSRIVEGVWLDE